MADGVKISGRQYPVPVDSTRPAPTILVVEDEVIVGEDIRRRLEMLGYKVVAVVKSGEAAIAKVRLLHPSLILMDIGIEGAIDGIETAEIIRREFDIPVVFATAYSDETTLDRAKATAPFGYVLKPFEERELRTTVEMALSKHHSEQRVRLSEQRYRTLLEDAADGILLLGPGGTIVDVNSKALELLSCSREQVLEREVGELLIESDTPGLSIPMPTQVGACIRTEGNLRRPDGTLLPIDVSARLLEDGTTEAIIRDVSERRKMEEALLRRLEKEHFVADFSARLITLRPDEVIQALPGLLGSVGDFMEADQTIVALLGPTGNEITEVYEWSGNGRSPFAPALLHRSPGAIPWSFARLARGENVCLFRVDDLPAEAETEQRLWGSMEIRSLLMVPILLGGILQGFLACATTGTDRMWRGEDVRLLRVLGEIGGNVLDRVRMYTELRESEDRYRRIARAMTDYAYTVTFHPDGSTTTAHGDSCLALTGYTLAEFDANPELWTGMVPEADRPRILKLGERVRAGDVVEPIQHRIVRKDGQVRWVRTTTLPHLDTHGRLLSADGLVQDITDVTRFHRPEPQVS